jgi:DUF4097 and DUF4098 domain-containing protein YvlB
MKTELQNLSLTSCLVASLLMIGTSLEASEFDKNLEKSFTVTGGGKLVVQVSRGSIEVKTEETDKVQIHVLRQVKGGSQAQADELFANHQLTFDQTGNTVSAVEKNKNQRSWSWHSGQPSLQVRYEIGIPKKFNVEMKTAGANIRLDDLEGNTIAHTSSGSITLGRISGTVEARDAGGNIAIESAGGTLTAHTSSGSIKVRDAGRKSDLSNAGGDIMIENATGSVAAATSSGSIIVGSAKGSVSAKNAGGNIRIGQVEENVTAQTSSGTIQIKTAKGNVLADNAGGSIEIGEAGATVAAHTSSGSIKIKSARGRIEAKNSGGDISIGEAGAESFLGTSSGTIRIGLAKGKVEAKNSGGSIEVKEAREVVLADTSSGDITAGFSASPAGNCHLSVAGGGIRLALPQSSSLDLDAKASGGEVMSELSVATEHKSPAQSGTLQGKINGGGPTLTLRASSGDIRLKQFVSTGTSAEAEDPIKK